MLFLAKALLPFSLLVYPVLSAAEADKKSEYVERAIMAIKHASTERLQSAVKAAQQIRNGCRSKIKSIEVQCILEKEREYCASFAEGGLNKCLLRVDVAVTNKLSERSFLTNRERYEILKSSHKVKQPYQKVLMHRYSNLVAQMALWTGVSCENLGDNLSCLGKKISRFCQDVGPGQGKTWQACVGGIVWFVGNQGKLLSPVPRVAVNPPKKK